MTSKYKFGARATKHKFGARAGKHKFETRGVKYRLGARAGKHKLGARAGKYKSGLVPVNTNWEQGRRPSKGPGAEKYNYPVLYVILAISHAQSSLVCNDVLILKR